MDIGFIFIHIPLFSFLLMLYIVVKMKNKKQIHFAFLVLILTLFIWTLGAVLLEYWFRLNNSTNVLMVDLAYIGLILTPVAILFLGLIYAKTRVKLSYKHALILIVPIISIILLLTNNYHHLFYRYISYEDLTKAVAFGPYFIIHSVYSYACILIGMFYLVFFSIKNAGFFSKQSIFIFLGLLISFGYNFILTAQIIKVFFYTNIFSFFFTLLFFFFAIIKFNFLNIVPIALQKVVDHISDAFVVLDENLNMIDFNKTFVNIFNISDEIRNRYFLEFLKSMPDTNLNFDELLDMINQAKVDEKTVEFEKNIVALNFDRFFKIEITSIYSNYSFLGSLILFKDITEHKRNMEALREQQAILLEQERLASLGQLIGGIAHNLKTPIMSLAGGIEALKDLTFEYRDSIDDKSVTIPDHKEIAKEMLSWLDKMKPYCAYMSDVISAVKGQAVQMNASSTVKFTVDELVKRVDLLMKHELKKYHCVLKVDSQIDASTEIKGEVNNLVQVFDNIIINAMQSYEGRIGTIDLIIVRSGDNIEFTFRDYAKGIPKQVADRLFKEMVTTKGKNGTGLGLYMSYSTIKGRFGGSMSFSSKEGKGTTFFISIPCIAYRNQEVNK